MDVLFYVVSLFLLLYIHKSIYRTPHSLYNDYYVEWSDGIERESVDKT